MSETTIGPYVLAECLGRGGMGQVFRAFDRRLERWVALKQIRPDLLAGEEARQRFLREARLAAALTHPSIVQVHDLLETPRGDWIVMELVEGQTLAQSLREGPRPLAEGLEIARAVAHGLAAAHARGILHRDLKSENVLVSTTGEVKILDFGIARRLATDETAEGLSDRSVEETRALLGTFRAMSPEQSRGLSLDPRSDLFAFGVLLYEVFGGCSPFRAEDPLVTLERVRSHQQPPLDELDATLPKALADLVDRLLDKNPARRPGSAREVSETLARLSDELAGRTVARERSGLEERASSARTWGSDRVGAQTSTGLPERPDTTPPDTTPPDTTAPDTTPPDTTVPDTRPSGTASSRARRTILRERRLGAMLPLSILPLSILVVSGLVSWMFLGLWSDERQSVEPIYVAVLDPEVPSDDELSRLTGGAVRAAMIEGLLSLEGIAPLTTAGLDPLPGTARQVGYALAADEILVSSLRCATEVCRLELQRLRAHDGQVLWIDLFDVPYDDVALTSSAVIGRLQRGYDGRSLRSGALSREVDPLVYAELLRLQRADRDKSLEPAEILSELAELRRRAPRFLELYRLEAKIAFDRFYYSRQPGDLEHALGLLEDARRLAPEDPQTLYQLVGHAIYGDRLELAAEALVRLESLEPGDARLERSRAVLLERQGETAQALEILRQSARRHPSWRSLFELASMEYRQGNHPAARSALESLLARAPDHFDASSFLAQLELLGGSPRRAIELYERLVERSPGPAELSNLALAHLLLGELGAAERRFAQVLATAPENPFFLLNLADVRYLRGRHDEARMLWERALARIATDPSQGDWQLETVRGQALAHLGRHREAVEAIQRALYRAPENTQVAYEAALVYAVIGETTSALFHAERALAELDPHWFSLAWFDELRRDPRFTDLSGSS